MKNDLINRSDAWNAIIEQPQLTKSIIRRVILQLPVANAVEVIRCKDCKAWKQHGGTGISGKCTYLNRLRVYDDFCSYGVRKDSNE